MRVLVLGGTHFVGRTIVERALQRGDEVTILNRGLSGTVAGDVIRLTADRTDPRALRDAIGDREWDAVLDTWMGAPRAARDTYQVLGGRTRHLGFVSSWSVYRRPLPAGADESAAVIDGDPADESRDSYPTAKRGSELAVLEAFGDRALIARAGPTLGPYDDIGSITWWLRRIAQGGRILVPGSPEYPLRYVDARDLASWMLGAADRHLGATFTVAGPAGRHTVGEFLATMRRVTGSDAELVWVPDDVAAAAGLRPYLDVPLWFPAATRDGSFDADVSAAHRAGLDTSRPLQNTLADTWSWLRREGEPPWRDTSRWLDHAAVQRALAEVS